MNWLKTTWGRHPFLCQMASAGAIGFIGDFSTQTYEKGSEHFDARRNLNFIIQRVFVMSPFYLLFQRGLERTVVQGAHIHWKTVVLKKMAADMFIYSPPAICVFFLSMAVIEGESFQMGIQRARLMFWELLKFSWCVWPVANTITYGLVPVNHRLVWTSIVSIFVNSVQSYFNQKGKSAQISKHNS